MCPRIAALLAASRLPADVGLSLVVGLLHLVVFDDRPEHAACFGGGVVLEAVYIVGWDIKLIIWAQQKPARARGQSARNSARGGQQRASDARALSLSLAHRCAVSWLKVIWSSLGIAIATSNALGWQLDT